MDIVMLGNGFDLHFQLPTTYLCFLKTAELIKKEGATKTSIGNIFEKIEDECKTIKDSRAQYKEVYDNYIFNDEEINELKRMRSIVNTNPWFKYFITTYNKDIGWIDFEKEIVKVLNQLSSFLNHTGFSPVDDKLIFQKRKNNIEPFDFFYNIYNEDKRYNCIREEFILKNKDVNNPIDINKSKIYESFYKKLQELSEALRIYLKIFVDNPLKTMKGNGSIKADIGFDDAGFVVTFNYTNTYEQLYISKQHVFHIHGNDDDRIILGINNDEHDEIDDIDTTLIMFKKYCQRAVFKTDIDYLELIKMLPKPNDTVRRFDEYVRLFVMGHSLDVSDKDIIEDLFWSSDEIIIYHHSETALASYIKNIVSIFGKEAFDDLRLNHNLKFISIA